MRSASLYQLILVPSVFGGCCSCTYVGSRIWFTLRCLYSADCIPSDVGLLGVAREIPHELFNVAIALGVPFSQVSYFLQSGNDIG